jgi:hypothetical protein
VHAFDAFKRRHEFWQKKIFLLRRLGQSADARGQGRAILSKCAKETCTHSRLYAPVFESARAYSGAFSRNGVDDLLYMCRCSSSKAGDTWIIAMTLSWPCVSSQAQSRLRQHLNCSSAGPLQRFALITHRQPSCTSVAPQMQAFRVPQQLPHDFVSAPGCACTATLEPGRPCSNSLLELNGLAAASVEG